MVPGITIIIFCGSLVVHYSYKTKDQYLTKDQKKVNGMVFKWSLLRCSFETRPTTDDLYSYPV